MRPSKQSMQLKGQLRYIHPVFLSRQPSKNHTYLILSLIRWGGATALWWSWCGWLVLVSVLVKLTYQGMSCFSRVCNITKYLENEKQWQKPDFFSDKYFSISDMVFPALFLLSPKVSQQDAVSALAPCSNWCLLVKPIMGKGRPRGGGRKNDTGLKSELFSIAN